MNITLKNLEAVVNRINKAVGNTEHNAIGNYQLDNAYGGWMLVKIMNDGGGINSAEAWLDKGLAKIESSMSKSGDVDPSAARAYAQECARRAAIRNPIYKDKAQVDLHVKVTRSEAEIESRIIELSAEAGIIGVIGSEAEDTEHQQIPHVLP